ncbi:MAG: hypothetical protein Q9214_002807, partial [Letrouitia sp. 1 TL-2023]
VAQWETAVKLPKAQAHAKALQNVRPLSSSTISGRPHILTNGKQAKASLTRRIFAQMIQTTYSAALRSNAMRMAGPATAAANLTTDVPGVHSIQAQPWPCPGDDDIQCCIAGGSGSDPPPPPTSPSNVGEKVLAKAKTQAGKPYAWGGGDCDSPTGDQPPWDNGEVGFDCSGLVCYAVCQVTGRDLFSEGLRNTHDMYCASESTLKYK